MPFTAGNIANPTGSTGRKIFVDALHCLITQEWDGDEPPKPERKAIGAHKLAYKLAKGAMRDDWKPGEALAYMQEFCDRAYGKPKEFIEKTSVSATFVMVGNAVDELPETVREKLRHALEKTAPMIENRGE
jgi:hypothetical protein